MEMKEWYLKINVHQLQNLYYALYGEELAVRAVRPFPNDRQKNKCRMQATRQIDS